MREPIGQKVNDLGIRVGVAIDNDEGQIAHAQERLGRRAVLHKHAVKVGRVDQHQAGWQRGHFGEQERCRVGRVFLGGGQGCAVGLDRSERKLGQRGFRDQRFEQGRGGRADKLPGGAAAGLGRR